MSIFILFSWLWKSAFCSFTYLRGIVWFGTFLVTKSSLLLTEIHSMISAKLMTFQGPDCIKLFGFCVNNKSIITGVGAGGLFHCWPDGQLPLYCRYILVWHSGWWRTWVSAIFLICISLLFLRILKCPWCICSMKSIMRYCYYHSQLLPSVAKCHLLT